MPAPRIDTTPTPSLFHLEWLVPVDQNEADDHERAIAERADALLRAAQFVGRDASQEARVWVEGALASACVSVTFEPGARANGFYLLDESLTERLACVVFDDLACVGAQESLGQADAILDALAKERDRSGAPATEPARTLRIRVKKRDER